MRVPSSPLTWIPPLSAAETSIWLSSPSPRMNRSPRTAETWTSPASNMRDSSVSGTMLRLRVFRSRLFRLDFCRESTFNMVPVAPQVGGIDLLRPDTAARLEDGVGSSCATVAR